MDHANFKKLDSIGSLICWLTVYAAPLIPKVIQY